MKRLIRWAIIIGAWLAVLYPLGTAIYQTEWTLNFDLVGALFPLFGIVAFTLLWLHSVSGVFEDWLRKEFDFDRFVQATAGLILLCIILHPLLLLIAMGFKVGWLFPISSVPYIWLGIVGWLLLIIYDITKPLKKKRAFFAKHWNKTLIISNIGFLLTFLHSRVVGGDLQTEPLKSLWLFYGITATAAIIYTYGIKPFRKS